VTLETGDCPAPYRQLRFGHETTARLPGPELAATARASAWTWFCGGSRTTLSTPGHFAGFVMFDFQRLRANTDITVAPPLAASISSTCWTSSCSSSRSSPAKRN